MPRDLTAAALVAAVLGFFVLVSPVHAQTAPGELQCLPKQEGGTGTYMTTGWSVNGWWAWHWCPQPDGRRSLTLAVGTPAVSLRNIGDRLTTVYNSADKLTAARASWRRHVTLSLADPVLTDVLRDAQSHMRAAMLRETLAQLSER
jgi:hypothetical protein